MDSCTSKNIKHIYLLSSRHIKTRYVWDNFIFDYRICLFFLFPCFCNFCCWMVREKSSEFMWQMANHSVDFINMEYGKRPFVQWLFISWHMQYMRSCGVSRRKLGQNSFYIMRQISMQNQFVKSKLQSEPR